MSKNIGQYLKQHLVDCTALVTIGNPAYTLIEKTLLHLPHSISIDARLIGNAITFAGIGSLSTILRDHSRKYFNITQESPESHIGIHDTAYGITFSAFASTGIYYASGIHSLEQLATGTITAMGISVATSWLSNYSVDGFRDLIDIEPSPRLPKRIKSLSSKAKKSLGAIAIAGSLLTTGLIYKYTPTYHSVLQQTPVSKIYSQ